MRPIIQGTIRRAIPLAVFTCLIGSSLAHAASPLFHVEIDDGDDHVSLQMPLALVQAAVAVLPADIEIDGQIEINDADLEVADLHALWLAVKSSSEETLLQIDSRDEAVTVAKRGDMLLVSTAEDGRHGAKVDAEIPFAVIDALFSGPSGRLDLAAALGVLAEMDGGPVLSIRDGADTVRLWVEAGDAAR